MTRFQYATLLAALVLFLGLYLGFDTLPKGGKKTAEPASATTEKSALDGDQLLALAREDVSAEGLKDLELLENQVRTAPEADRIPLMKRLSGWWYAAGNIPAAGVWAEKVAQSEKSGESWSVAGATFYQALVGTEAPVLREFCARNAVHAFEEAAKLEPEKVEHRVNVALVLAEQPLDGNAMAAVQLLRELESQHPESPAVYNALGRLAIKTQQWDRAIERLEKAYALDPENPNTPCLLARAYEGAGNKAKSEEYAQKCK